MDRALTRRLVQSNDGGEISKRAFVRRFRRVARYSPSRLFTNGTEFRNDAATVSGARVSRRSRRIVYETETVYTRYPSFRQSPVARKTPCAYAVAETAPMGRRRPILRRNGEWKEITNTNARYNINRKKENEKRKRYAERFRVRV